MRERMMRERSLARFASFATPATVVSLWLVACGDSRAPGGSGAWRHVHVLEPGVDSELHAVAADAEHGRYVAVGWGETVLAGRGAAWAPISLDHVLDAYEAPRGLFEAVWVGGGHVFTAGGLGHDAGGIIDLGGASPAIAFADPPRLDEPFIFGSTVTSVAGNAREAWVAGTEALARFDAATSAWTVDSTAPPYPVAVWAHPDGTLWMAAAGSVYTRPAAGGAWEQALTTDGAEFPTTLWGDARGSGTILAAGFRIGSEPAQLWVGVVWLRRNGVWSRYAGDASGGLPPGTSRLYATWGRGPDDLFVAGDSGLLHFDGAGWSREPLPTAAPLRGLAGLDGEVVAVGDDGIFARGR